eukprot:TRINITY_DN49592_c0_g1_i1.p1 TRINITY_DN49592_c0_g1~~TRINITY_DN49592_c0_g1_i1.p1  ORF type:complete len:720 (-),score=104.30 TRINITY_DN49592_c0_g1_i1:221-2344(-)
MGCAAGKGQRHRASKPGTVTPETVHVQARSEAEDAPAQNREQLDSTVEAAGAHGHAGEPERAHGKAKAKAKSKAAAKKSAADTGDVADGFTEEVIEEIIDAIKKHVMPTQRKGGQGCAVAVHGEIIASYCKPGYSLDIQRNIHSCTKTITGLMYIDALSRGKAPPLETPLHTLFPDYPWDKKDPRKKKWTVRHVLEMTMEFDLTNTTSLVNGEVCGRDDPWTPMLDVPIIKGKQPGDSFKYQFQIASDLLAFIVQRSTGQTIQQYMDDHFFKPMGLNITIPMPFKGFCLGCDGALVSIRQMIALGTLVAQDGEWNGKQLMDKAAMQNWKSTVREGTFQHLWTHYPGKGLRFTGIWGQVILIMPDGIVVACQSEDDGHHSDFAAQSKAEEAYTACHKVYSVARRPPPLNPPKLLEQMENTWKQPYVLMVSFKGKIVAHRAVQMGMDTKKPPKGAGRFVASLIYTLAVGRGDAPGFDTPLSKVFPDEWSDVKDERIKALTVGDIFKHVVPWKGEIGSHMMPMLKADDPIKYALAVGLRDGAKVNVAHTVHSISADLLVLALQKSIKQDMYQYATEHLFSQLAIEAPVCPKWGIFKDGKSSGNYGGPHMSARELFTLVTLFQQDGALNGKELVCKKAMKQWKDKIPKPDGRSSGKKSPGGYRTWGHFFGSGGAETVAWGAHEDGTVFVAMGDHIPDTKSIVNDTLSTLHI